MFCVSVNRWIDRAFLETMEKSLLAHKFADGSETSRYAEADLPPALKTSEKLLVEIKPEWLRLASHLRVPEPNPLFHQVVANDSG